MTTHAVDVAERMGFEAFLNCYLREVDGGEWCRAAAFGARSGLNWLVRGPWIIHLALKAQRVELAVEVTYRSQVQQHAFGAVAQRNGEGADWQPSSRLPVFWLVARELTLSRADRDTAAARTQELELLSRILESLQLTRRYLEGRSSDSFSSGERFIDSEQSIVFGHWAHPTPKSRQGIAQWQHSRFAPELRGEFQLRVFAASARLVEQDCVVGRSAASLVAEALASDPKSAALVSDVVQAGEVLLPVHPLQADWLLHQPHVLAWMDEGAVRDLGALGPAFCATSSVRTVYNAECAWMFKLSIPVRLTNSLRFNQRHELRAGVTMARLLQRLDWQRTGFTVLMDPAYITLRAPDVELSGFETILRDNPFQTGRDFATHCIAAIVHEQPFGTSRLSALIGGLSLIEGREACAVAWDWFQRYFECAIEPVIRLYDEHGIALEAHQQNSLLDLQAGYPRRCCFRDNQGYYVSEECFERLCALEPTLSSCPELRYPDELIRRRLCYYLIANQLFSVVHRLGREGLLDEPALLANVRQRLGALHPRLGARGRRFVELLLEGETLPCKANLLTRVHDVDELTTELEQAIYVETRSPLAERNTQLGATREVA